MMAQASKSTCIPATGTTQDRSYASEIETATAAGAPDTSARKLAARVRLDEDIRWDLVHRIRAEIALGIYETPERIDATIDGLVEELFGRPR